VSQIAPGGKPPVSTGGATGPVNSVGFTLSQLGLETARQFAELLGALGLEPRHFAVLSAVHSEEGQSQQAFGDYLAIPASTMVAIVDQLEGKGLLERRLHLEDRRTRTLHLTELGETLLSDALTVAFAQEAKICQGLDPLERTQLLLLLRRLSANLGVSPTALPDRGSGERPDQF